MSSSWGDSGKVDMPKLLCKCGEVLRYGEIPCPLEWRIISDSKFEEFRGTVNAEEIYMATRTALRCPRCGRLWVFWNEGDAPVEYVPVASTTDPALPT
jgi:hypothetical protein